MLIFKAFWRKVFMSTVRSIFLGTPAKSNGLTCQSDVGNTCVSNTRRAGWGKKLDSIFENTMYVISKLLTINMSCRGFKYFRWSIRIYYDSVGGLPRWCQCRRCKSLGFNPWDQEDSLEEGMAIHFSILPGESNGQRSLVGYNPWGWRVRDDWSDLARMQFVPRERESQSLEPLCKMF